MPAFSARALRLALAALAGATALLAAPPALAGLVSFDYTGQAGNGATVVGTFGWDTSTPGTPSVIGQGNVVLAKNYVGGGFLTGQVSGGVLNGKNISSSGLTWNVMDLDPACVGCAADGLSIINSNMFVFLFDDTRTALNSLALPTALDLSNWGSDHHVRLLDSQLGAGGSEDFTILSLKLSAAATSPTAPGGLTVPEPGTLALLPLAAVCGFAARRRNAR